MPPKLPKEFYWVDLKLMDDFFRLDPVNEAFYETFMSLREEPFGVTLDAVKVFNEVYYTITRYRYENTYITGGFFYPSEIEADLGWKYSVELVMTMSYWIAGATQEEKFETFRNSVKTLLLGNYVIIADINSKDRESNDQQEYNKNIKNNFKLLYTFLTYITLRTGKRWQP